MIHVTIELWPKGQEMNKKLLGVIDIVNTDTGTHKRGNYFARVLRDQKMLGSLVKAKWSSVSLFGFPRHKLTAYDLLFRVLAQAQGKKNQKFLDRYFHP